MVMELVNEGIQLIEERYSQERKENVGRGTLYLTLLPDESRLNFTIDQVLALYLIDMTDLIKSNQPEQKSPKTDSVSKKSGQYDCSRKLEHLERDNFKFYMTVCCFV